MYFAVAQVEQEAFAIWLIRSPNLVVVSPLRGPGLGLGLEASGLERRLAGGEKLI